MSLTPEVQPALVRVARAVPTTAPASETRPVWPASVLGLSEGVPPPAIDV